MELEKAGTTWEPQLKQLARNLLLQKYTLGVVDEMLPFDRKVNYEDLARAAAGDRRRSPVDPEEHLPRHTQQRWVARCLARRAKPETER